MKNFFELFGFISMACISAAIIFIFMGKTDGFKLDAKTAAATEYSEMADVPNAPKSVTKGIRDSYASDSGSARRAKNGRESAATTASAEDRLKALYNDDAFVASAIKQWKNMVADVADEYNVKPEVLLANAIVQSYMGDYSKSALRQDAAQHAGDRVMSAASAAKRYTFGWTVQKMTEQHQLNRYFATEIPVASASADRMVSAKNSAKKGSASQPSTPKVTPNTQNNPAEEGFKNMVAKEYGFNTWSGLQRLADADMKADATRRVKSLMMAARIK